MISSTSKSSYFSSLSSSTIEEFQTLLILSKNFNVFNTCLAIVTVALIYAVALPRRQKFSLSDKSFPGPPKVPFIGNLFNFPRSNLHIKFSEWAKEYGDIFSLKLFKKTIIVLNSPSVMKEVLDVHSVATSNRPKSVIADMINPHSTNLGTGRHANATWKTLRKAVNRVLGNDNLNKVGSYQQAEATQLMWDLSHTPDQWHLHIKRYKASLMLGITFGKRSPLLSSPDVSDFFKVHPLFINAVNFGTMPSVNLFPIISYVPRQWAKWKQLVYRVKDMQDKLYSRLLGNVEDRLKNGIQTDAFMEHAVKNAEEWGLDNRELLMHLGGVLLEGAFTTASSLQNALLIFASYPSVQKKAQEEIDSVVGTSRPPTSEDIRNLPYISAMVHELLRFRPIGPLGFPHEMVNDEVINGVLYPKDAVIFLNIWAICHDERYYEKPDEFIPERFLEHPYGIKPGVADDPARRANIVFGAGRRVCPGTQLALSTLTINIMNIVWAFNILPHIDPTSGETIMPDLDDYSSGLLAMPNSTPLRIRTRSSMHKQLIDTQFSAAGNVLSMYELDSEMNDKEKEFNKTYRDNITATMQN